MLREKLEEALAGGQQKMNLANIRALLAAALLLPSVAFAIPEGPAYPSAEWTAREAQNFARISEATREQLTNPALAARMLAQSTANLGSYIARSAQDPSWSLSGALNLPVLPLCSTWALPCTGDPFLYPGIDPFYDSAEVIPVVFYDRECARLSGRVWAPKNAQGRKLPGVVILNGSVQAPETLYWWAAKILVQAGYQVLTFDPRGQGRSDNVSPALEPGTNLNPSVFWEGLVDAIDFFHSSSVQPYPHNQTCAGTYPTEVAAFNPLIDRLDRDRLGVAGHSMGAAGATIVQSYGAVGAEPWPGLIDSSNPVDVIVAWDALGDPEQVINANGLGALPVGGSGDLINGGPLAGTPVGALLAGTPGISNLLAGVLATAPPAIVPRVPAMGFTSEYGFGIGPYLVPPDPDKFKQRGFAAWDAAGVPVFDLIFAGSTHLDFSLLPALPATSWCPRSENGACVGGWGRPLIEHYTLAWFDRWLKQPGEAGYADADARLLADADWQQRYSFYFRSARSFPDHNDKAHRCDDIRAGCSDTAVEPPRNAGGSAGDGGSGGGGFGWAVLAGLLLLRMLRRRS
jgi:pimeloyl-ACP methyl ester carboxylesterase